MLHRSLTDGDGGYIWQRLVHSSTRRKGRPSDPRDCLALCLTTGKYKPAYLYGNIMVYSHKAATYHFRAYHLHSVWIEKPITWRVCSDHSGVVHVCQLYDYYWGVLITKGSFWCNIYARTRIIITLNVRRLHDCPDQSWEPGETVVLFSS